MARSSLVATLLTSALCPLLAGTGTPARAAEAFIPYPSNEALREVQLAAIACGRENTASSCERARSLADPLMDHPLLPGFCKDAVWEVVQSSQTTSSNDFTRWDRVDQAAERLVTSCRRRPAAPARTDGPPGGPPSGAPSGQPPGNRPSGFGFGTAP